MAESKNFDPFREMKGARRRLDSFFSNFPAFIGEDGARPPLIDISDKGKNIELVAELPGARKEDIEVSVDSDSIEISAKSGSDVEEEKKSYYFHERSYSSFRRRLQLPVEVIPGKAEAGFKNGVLTVTVPKKKAEKEKKGVKLKIK